jgi:hypothetical protein
MAELVLSCVAEEEAIEVRIARSELAAVITGRELANLERRRRFRARYA